MEAVFRDHSAAEIAADHRSRYGLAGMALVACVFAVNVFRAAHQSVTADEAYTYDLFIASPFDTFFTYYSANNHVLHTLLSRFSVHTLGLSELTLRLPSLLGALLYLIFVYKLCRHAFTASWTFLLAVAALTLNPFIMDYLSVARGYGMALGLFMGALYFAIRFLDDPWHAANRHRVSATAIMLGLSITANLTFVFPAVALAGALSLLLLADKKWTGSPKDRLLWIVDRVWLRMLAPAVLLLAISLSHANRGAFYYGEDSLRKTLWSLVGRSLFHQYDVWAPGAVPSVVSRATGMVTDWVVPLMLTMILATFAPVCWRWFKERDVQSFDTLDRTYFVTGAVTAISLAMLIAAHAISGVRYPSDRTAIYLVALFTLQWTLLLERSVSRLRPGRVIGLLASAPVALAIVLFLFGFTTSYYYEWRYDAGTKRIFHLLEEQKQFSADRPMKLGVNWRFDYSLNFYRRMYRADWLAEVNRDPTPKAGGFDYYVLLPEDEPAMKELGLRVIYRDAVSRQEVALPRDFPALSSKGHF